MKIELGSWGQDKKSYRLRLENGRIGLSKRPTGVVAETSLRAEKHTSAQFELGTWGGKAYRLRLEDRKFSLTKRHSLQEGDELSRTAERLKTFARNTVKEVFAPKWTWGLIGINTALFALAHFQPELVFQKAGVQFTPAAFLFHENLPHLAANMGALYLLGRDVENAFGGKKMALTYLLSGMLGTIPGITPHESKAFLGIKITTGTLGASGADMGLLGLSLVNAVKERSYGKAAALGTVASLALGVDLGPSIDKLGHAVGFVSGLLGGGILSGNNLFGEVFRKKAERRAQSLAAGIG